MSDIRTQRNLAIGVAALAVAFAAGYAISNRSGEVRPAGTPQVGQQAPATPVQDAPSPAVEAEQSAAVERTPPTASVGERRVQRTDPGRDRPASPTGGESPVVTEPAAGDPSPRTDDESAVAEEPAVARVERVTVPASTRIVLELRQAVSSQTSSPGDEVVAELAEPIRVGGETVVPAGTRVVGRVTEAQALKKVGGKAILGLSFDRLESGYGGATIAAGFRREGKSETGKDAATIAAGAAIGAILGNQAKHNDRGKLIGAAVGAAAGTAVAAKTPGVTVDLEAGARLELTLRDDVEVTIDGD